MYILYLLVFVIVFTIADLFVLRQIYKESYFEYRCLFKTVKNDMIVVVSHKPIDYTTISSASCFVFSKDISFRQFSKEYKTCLSCIADYRELYEDVYILICNDVIFL